MAQSYSGAVKALLVGADGEPGISAEVSEPPISGAAAITAHDTDEVTPGRQFLVNCTVAGNVKVQFSDASELTFPVNVGLSILPWAVRQVYVTDTTATATYANLL